MVQLFEVSFQYDSSLVSHRQLHPGGKMEEYQEDIFVS